MLCNAENIIRGAAPVFRSFATKQRAYNEIKIPVAWGHVAGKWWEPLDRRPILALHGWQDNCGTFDRLIPLLKEDVGFLAIDLPGHGRSSWLPPGMFYHNLNYTMLITYIANYFGWPKVTLIGHSLGSISSYVYTMLFPETVDYLICIDGLQPVFKKNNAPRLALGIQELLKYDELAKSIEEPPTQPLDVMRQKITMVNNNSISAEHCDCILQRNISPSKSDPDKYYFSRDPRLKSRIILNWSLQDLLQGAQRVTVPVQLIKFTDSGYFGDEERFHEIVKVLQKASQDCKCHYIDGTHHTHLNNPERVSPLINNFIDTYNVNGGVSADIKNVI